MATFITPYSGSAVLNASNGLQIVEQGRWTFSSVGFNDGATFGVGLTYPNYLDSGLLHLRAVNWTISVIGNELTSYTDPDTSITYPAAKCRITVTGRWSVLRQPNSNSFNGQGVIYTGLTVTDQGERSMNPYLLNFVPSTNQSYVIQGADVDGGAQDTFSSHTFYCRITESATSRNSNKEFQSNSIATPTWIYTYSKSWQID